MCVMNSAKVGEIEMNLTNNISIYEYGYGSKKG